MLNPSMIAQQSATLAELYREELPALLSRGADIPENITCVYALGNGDSYHAALCAAEFFAAHCDARYIPMPAYTFLHRELPRLENKGEGVLVVCVSASGSSKLSAQILTEVSTRNAGTPLAMVGKSDCLMAQAAGRVMDIAISEKGRTPGIRTFAASVCGLMKLACLLSREKDVQENLSETLVQMADFIPALLGKGEELAKAVSAWNWQHASAIGTQSVLGCAQFVCAKLAEAAGVFACAQEAEEWGHVESMTYPFDTPVMAFIGSEDEEPKLRKAVEVSHRAGHKALAILIDGMDTQAYDAVLALPAFPREMLPLLAYVPMMPMSQAIAQAMGRAMFLSDQPFKLY